MFIPQRAYLILVFSLFLFSCNESQKDSTDSYHLSIIDTLKVDYRGDVHASDFKDGIGVIYNFPRTEFVKFDTTGKVLHINEIPIEGEEAIYHVNGLKITDNQEILLHSLKGEIGILDKDLQLKQRYQMPFPNYTMELRSNVRLLDEWQEQVLVFFPGRDGKSPYTKGYFKNNHLLEKVNLETGSTEPMLKLPKESQYQSDLFFEQPSILVAIQNDLLYLVIDNEPFVHLYDLKESEQSKESISIEASNFVQIKGQPIPIGNDGTVLKPALIKGIFPFENGFAIFYNEGQHAKEQGEINKNRQVFKLYEFEKGWSSELELPPSISFILNFESPESGFYAITEGNTSGRNNQPLELLKLKLKK